MKERIFAIADGFIGFVWGATLFLNLTLLYTYGWFLLLVLGPIALATVWVGYHVKWVNNERRREEREYFDSLKDSFNRGHKR